MSSVFTDSTCSKDDWSELPVESDVDTYLPVVVQNMESQDFMIVRFAANKPDVNARSGIVVKPMDSKTMKTDDDTEKLWFRSISATDGKFVVWSTAQ